MEQFVITDEISCRTIGNPDFNLNKCTHCREDADPVYKLCLTLRITHIAEKINNKSDQIGPGYPG